MILPLLVFKDYALFFLRLIVGLFLIIRGKSDFTDALFSGKNFNYRKFFLAVFEISSGLFIFLGIGTQAFAFLLAIQSIGKTFFKIKEGKKFLGGYDFDLLLTAASFILMTMGGGFFAIIF